MDQIKPGRIASLDLLKGLVIVFMALDHTRDYFHYDAFFYDPTDPEHTNLILFLTRWITHYCAPVFSFLAGTSAFLVGRRKSKGALSKFLLTRGIWLVFIEFTIVYFGWSFNPEFNSIGMLVIWSLGISMILLAGLIHLTMPVILTFSLIIIFGHNLLDNVHFEGNILWGILHERSFFELANGFRLRVIYPIIPWVGVMSLGYWFGKFYDKSMDPGVRRKLFTIIGSAAIGLFIVIRGINAYGNPKHWSAYETFTGTLYSFLDPLKYPPSLSYLLMTLGPALLFLAFSENLRGRVVNFFCVFGRVPFFFYILHIYLIHLIALFLAKATGFGFQAMILHGFVSSEEALKGYGTNLYFVYLIWVSVVLALYPLCRKFSQYKLAHKDKPWLSYL